MNLILPFRKKHRLVFLVLIVALLSLLLLSYLSHRLSLGNVTRTIIQLEDGGVEGREGGQERGGGGGERRRASENEIQMLTEAREEAGRYRWAVNASARDPTEVRHVVFIKVHKAASSTLFNLFMRLATSRTLNIMLPDSGNHLQRHDDGKFNLLSHPPSPPFHFDLLCNHIKFDRAIIQPFFPADTKFVAIVREPFQQMQSAYRYYTTIYHMGYLMFSPSFDHFLRYRQLFEPADPYHSMTNNRMSLDMGLKGKHFTNSSYVPTFLRQVDREFDLVLIAERFDESMVLMKRLFRWTMKDIIYLKINVHVANGTKREDVDPDVWEQFRRFQVFDIALYDHYVKVLEKRIAQQGPNFTDEVKDFVRVNGIVSDFCNEKSPSSSSSSSSSSPSPSISPSPSPERLVVPGSRWSAEFSVWRAECSTLATGEMKLNAWASRMQLQRLAPAIFQEEV